MSYLDELIDSTFARVQSARALTDDDEIARRIAAAPEARPFGAALAGPDISLIAEIKRASPSAGDIAPDLDAKVASEAYARGGAAAISVLTEPDRFRGSLDDLMSAREAGLPVLCKDFVVDEFQVRESRAAGADAILLIVRILEGDRLVRLFGAASKLEMDCLVEVFDEEDLERALDLGATIVGVNHRDLHTFEVDPERTKKLAPMVPPEVILVGLSGVRSRADVVELAGVGARAVLVGEALGRSEDPAATVKSLLGAA